MKKIHNSVVFDHWCKQLYPSHIAHFCLKKCASHASETSTCISEDGETTEFSGNLELFTVKVKMWFFCH